MSLFSKYFINITWDDDQSYWFMRKQALGYLTSW